RRSSMTKLVLGVSLPSHEQNTLYIKYFSPLSSDGCCTIAVKLMTMIPAKRGIFGKLVRSCCAVPMFLLLFFVPVYSEQLLSTEDLRIEVSLSDVQISPDGKRAVFIVSRLDYQSDSSKSELVLIELESGHQKTLSRQKGIFEPSWSPSGDKISFLAETAKGAQIFVMSPESTNAQQITQVDGGILHHTWAPDGMRFALIAQEAPPTKTGLQKFNDSFEVGSNSYLTTEPAARNYAAITGVDGGKIQRITPKDLTIATDFYNSSLSWFLDGSKLAINIYPSSRSGDSDLGRVHLLEVANGSLLPVTSLN